MAEHGARTVADLPSEVGLAAWRPQHDHHQLGSGAVVRRPYHSRPSRRTPPRPQMHRNPFSCRRGGSPSPPGRRVSAPIVLAPGRALSLIGQEGTDTHVGCADGAPPPDGRGSRRPFDIRRRVPRRGGAMAPAGRPSLMLAADVVDDLRRVRIANENRLRQLTRAGSTPDGERGFGLSRRPPGRRPPRRHRRGDGEASGTTPRSGCSAHARHPLGPWVKATKGIGEKQAARLIAAVGDPLLEHPATGRGPCPRLWAIQRPPHTPGRPNLPIPKPPASTGIRPSGPGQRRSDSPVSARAAAGTGRASAPTGRTRPDARVPVRAVLHQAKPNPLTAQRTTRGGHPPPSPTRLDAGPTPTTTRCGSSRRRSYRATCNGPPAPRVTHDPRRPTGARHPVSVRWADQTSGAEPEDLRRPGQSAPRRYLIVRSIARGITWTAIALLPFGIASIDSPISTSRNTHRRGQDMATKTRRRPRRPHAAPLIHPAGPMPTWRSRGRRRPGAAPRSRSTRDGRGATACPAPASAAAPSSGAR